MVDDGSTERIKLSPFDEEPAVRLIALERNGGFARACNAGAGAASAELFVFLNNDTIPTTGWLDFLVEDAENHPEAAAIGAKLLFPNGVTQHAGVAIGQDRWPRHLYAGFPGEHAAVNRSKEVAAVTAACLLVRRRDFEEVDGFDTAFLNGYEDIDLCLRLRERGRTIRYCARSVVYHLESVTRWHDSPQSTADNDRLYAERWLARVTPDDVQHYLDDGVLSMEYDRYYPATIEVDPALAVVRRSGESLDALEDLLQARSRQVMELLATHTRHALRQRVATSSLARVVGTVEDRSAKVEAQGVAHRVGGTGSERLVSVLLPVKNEGSSLRELLPLVLGQDVQASLEIVAVDSGSEDDTIDVLREYGATIVLIEPEAFDHGLTRNLAADHANGDVLVFLNGRTRPVDDKWLAPMLGAIDEDPVVAGVCSRVIARPDADILVRSDLEVELSGSPRRERKQIVDWEAYRRMSTEERRAFLNFHTVSAVLRSDLFSRHPFRSVRTIGEDLLWAREILEAGWALVHEPASMAHHSHTYSLDDLFARNVDDGIANRDINDRALSKSEVLPTIEALVDRDWCRLRNESSLGAADLEKWQREAILRRVAQVVGQWVGVNYRELPEGVAAAFSRIEHTRARKY